MEEHQQQQYKQLRLKCIVLGSANAGKTCLLRRYINGTFEGGTNSNNNEQSIRRKRSTTSTQGADYYVKKVDNSTRDNHPDVFVQLWDTAGKERLHISPNTAAKDYRRSSNFYQFLSIRPSSKSSITGSSSSACDYKSSSNCNNYEHRYNNWNAANDKRRSGRQRRNTNAKQSDKELQNNTQSKQQYSAKQSPSSSISSSNSGNYHNTPAEDALFKNIDACMLVYDATSSMSFLHLMQWHSEWTERLKYWERDKEEEVGEKNRRRVRNKRKRIPFIVVANKIDLLESKIDTSTTDSDTTSSGKASHRSVMGLRDDEYEGKQLKYEYAAEEASNTTSTTSLSSAKRPSPLTYSLKETQWSTDQTYLTALQHTEDELPANRQMILLWCQRNNIPHVEASALTGEGVIEAMKQLIDAGVDELRRKQEMDIHEQESEEEEMITPQEQETALSEEVDDGIVHHHQQQDQQTAKDFTLNNDGTEYHGQEINEPDTPQLNGDIIGSVAREEEAAVVDPSQYYFVYQPRKEEDSLDLFARYSPKEEERLCSPFKCWMPFFSYCRL